MFTTNAHHRASCNVSSFFQQLLKQQLSSQQEELKRRESRWASTHGRLRQQIDSLHQENAALRDEVQPLDLR